MRGRAKLIIEVCKKPYCALFKGHSKACDATLRTHEYLVDRMWREANRNKSRANSERFYAYKRKQKSIAGVSA